MKLYDPELETAILAIMVIDASVIPNITREVQESDFFDPFNREVFRTILALNAKGCVDIVSLTRETGMKNPAYIASLTDTMASSANWQYYTHKVKQLSMYRGFMAIIEESKSTTPDTIEKDLDDFIRRATKLSDISGGSNIKSAKELIPTMIETIETAYKNKGALIGLDTGLSGLNDKIDGFQSEFIILGARPSCGKTACSVNMMIRQAKKGIPVGFVSAEMKDNKIMMRMISDMTNINSRSIRSGLLKPEHFAKITDCMEVMNNTESFPFYIDDSSRKLEQVVSTCRIMVRMLGVKILYIDHAGMITVEGDLPAWEKESKKSKTLKALQKELNVPLILLSQVGRQTEQKPPTLADLRGSGSYEEDADTVLFLHRERLESVNDEPIPAELNVAKARDGEIGIVDLLFFPKVTRFVDKAKNTP
jgi:replicative DNA helicase